ncbi:flippase [uncultured Veillonella sp.]|jgi:O-antigen transporter|uniref:flippase n=1 Tax=uncultured Veillonella sp. TaxID=159268 RepID=UPI0028D584BE|nr:flippase [uncultured Veillonella sp.]
MSNEARQLIENIFSMVSLRALEYILSFLLVPYLLIILGPERIGEIAFMQGWLSYASLIINYGFNLTAPRALAEAEPSQYSYLFSKYFWATNILGLVVTIIVGIIFSIMTFVNLQADIWLLLALYSGVLGNMLFPIWFYQGIQRMRFITIISLSSRLISMICIFIVVKESSDYIWAGLFQSVPSLIAGIISLILLSKQYKGLFKFPNFGSIWKAYQEGWQIFLSSFVINLYTGTTVVILGILTNNTVVGHYTAADKLIGCVRRFISACNNAIYPHIIATLKVNVEKGLRFLYSQLLVYIIMGSIVAIVFIMFSDQIIYLLLGGKYLSSVPIFEILAILPLLISASNVLGAEMMLAFKLDNIFSRILMFGAIINTLAIFPLTSQFGAVGTAWTQVITEGSITLIMAIVLYKKGFFRKNLFKR